MIPSRGRPETGSLPLGGKAQRAQGAQLIPSRGRPETGSLPLGGKAQRAPGAA
jgi:hypothetical protein